MSSSSQISQLLPAGFRSVIAPSLSAVSSCPLTLYLQHGRHGQRECLIIERMDQAALMRLRAWLDRPEIAELDPPRVDALAHSLTEADPPVRVERWGTIVGYDAGPPRRRRSEERRVGKECGAGGTAEH